MSTSDYIDYTDPAVWPDKASYNAWIAEALEEAEALREELEEGSAYEAFQARYYNDPVAFVWEAFIWEEEDEGPAPYQEDILNSLVTEDRVSVRGPHGLGKTALAAWIVLWFALTRDGRDWKIPTTASVWRQLSKYLWPEIHKWARRLNPAVIGRGIPETDSELLTLSLKLDTGEAFAVASKDSSLIEGAHADHLLYIFDEAKAIQDSTFDAAEGAFSGAGKDTGREAIAIAISTPGEPVGRFYDIHSKKSGYSDWFTRKVTTEEAIAAGRISGEWVEARRRQWGEESSVYQNRVAGEFASGEEAGVIPLAWVEAANDRWRELRDQDWEDVDPFLCVGVDVARFGKDKITLALRYGGVIKEIRTYAKEDTMITAGRVKGILDRLGGYAMVDVIGIGAGVLDRLKEQRLRAYPFNASVKTTRRDKSGELGFFNTRSAGWWNLREVLDPANGHSVALPPNDKLTGDLVTPRWRVMSGGKIRVEGKEDVKKRINRSTDDGDAVVMAFWNKPPDRGLGIYF